MSNLWKRLGDLEGRVPPEPVRPTGRSGTWQEISELQARIARHNRELLDAGWTQSEIEAAYPQPSFEEDYAEVVRLIKEAEREAPGG